MNIFISNLSFNVNDDDLKTLFDEYGEVFSAKVITDKFSGKSRGFGFVEMNNEKEAQAAIDKLNQAKYDGKVITVNVAKPRTERTSNNSYNDRRRY
jgi:RNA recognition motif-containing protein